MAVEEEEEEIPPNTVLVLTRKEHVMMYLLWLSPMAITFLLTVTLFLMGAGKDNIEDVSAFGVTISFAAIWVFLFWGMGAEEYPLRDPPNFEDQCLHLVLGSALLLMGHVPFGLVGDADTGESTGKPA